MPRLEALYCVPRLTYGLSSPFGNLRITDGCLIPLRGSGADGEPPIFALPQLQEAYLELFTTCALQTFLSTSPLLTKITMTLSVDIAHEVLELMVTHPIAKNLVQFAFYVRNDYWVKPTTWATEPLTALLTAAPKLETLQLAGLSVAFDTVLAAAPNLRWLTISKDELPQPGRNQALGSLQHLHTLILDVFDDSQLDRATIALFATRIVHLRLGVYFRPTDETQLAIAEFVHAGLRTFEIDCAVSVTDVVWNKLMKHRPSLHALVLGGQFQGNTLAEPNFDKLLEACGRHLKALFINLVKPNRDHPALWKAIGMHCPLLEEFYTETQCDGIAQIVDLLRSCRRLESISCHASWSLSLKLEALSRLTARRRLRVVVLFPQTSQVTAFYDEQTLSLGWRPVWFGLGTR